MERVWSDQSEKKKESRIRINTKSNDIGLIINRQIAI